MLSLVVARQLSRCWWYFDDQGNISGRTLFTEVEAAVNTTLKGPTSAATSQSDKRNSEMIAERHADRIFQVNCPQSLYFKFATAH